MQGLWWWLCNQRCGGWGVCWLGRPDGNILCILPLLTFSCGSSFYNTDEPSAWYMHWYTPIITILMNLLFGTCIDITPWLQHWWTYSLVHALIYPHDYNIGEPTAWYMHWYTPMITILMNLLLGTCTDTLSWLQHWWTYCLVHALIYPHDYNIGEPTACYMSWYTPWLQHWWTYCLLHALIYPMITTLVNLLLSTCFDIPPWLQHWWTYCLLHVLIYPHDYNIGEPTAI